MMQHGASALGADASCTALLVKQAVPSALRAANGRRRAAASSHDLRTGLKPSGVTRVHSRGGHNVNVTAAVADSRPRTAQAAPFSISHGPVTLSEDKYQITSQRVPVTVNVQREPNGNYAVNITCGLKEPVVLHWGVNNWQLPASAAWPEGTKQFDKGAVQSQFNGGKIRISFPSNVAPESIKFVLKQLNPEAWHNCGGTDFHVKIRPASQAEVLDQRTGSGSSRGPSTPDTLLAATVRNLLINIAEFENRTELSLFQRFQLALDLVPTPEKAEPDTLAVLLAWLQYSAHKHLPWHQGNTYKATEMAQAQQELAQRFADVASRAPDSTTRQMARQILALLPRGGGDAGEIPGGIAHMMQSNNIREGHSNHNGIEDRFLEEWKKKLEGSTTQEDVAICEAYLHFLQSSGDWNQFYKYIWDNHRISRNRLETMDKPLRSPAVHLPQLIPAMKHFLWVLKITHSGITLDESLEFAKGYLDEELKAQLYDILAHRNEWYVPGKIADARARLAKVWRRPEGAPRDVLMLDIALEKHFRLCIERTDKGALKDDDVIEVVNLVLRNAAVAGEWPELEKAQRFWEKVRTAPDRWSKDWVARASAAANFVTVALEAGMDRLAEHVAQPAQVVGEVTRVREDEILKFAEEMLHGQSPAMLTELINMIERPLRDKEGAPQWVIGSTAAGVATGRLLRKGSLKEIEGAVFRDPTVLIIDGGVKASDEIPDGVVAILATGGVEQMGHLAIQARARKVFLAGCYDHEQLNAWSGYSDSPVNVAVTPAGEVVMAPAAPYSGPKDTGRGASGFYRSSHARTSQWVIAEDQFTEELVGAKALKCRALRTKMIGTEVAVPATVAIPFGTFERVLSDPINGPICDEFVDLVNQLGREPHPARLSASLEQIRMLLSTCLAPPDGLSVELASLAVRHGLVDAYAAASEVDDFSAIWDAICKVWASKWTDRAWLSRRARGEPDSSVSMSVLIQKIVPAQFSFVLKTAEPSTGAHGHMSGEVVIGLGEALVGNFPGRALTFSTQQGSREVKVKTLPSKAVAFRVSKTSALICRPDWSSADSEDASGARLFESAPVSGVDMDTPEYSEEELVWNTEYQQGVLQDIAAAGWKVADAFGGKPLEVEGVYSAGRVAVVQARPQVFPSGSRASMADAYSW